MRELRLNSSDFADLSTEILAKGSSFCFKAHGSSMFPFIRDGDILTVQSTGTKSLCIGDVVFFRSVANNLTAHRLIGETKLPHTRLLKVRGDAHFRQYEQIDKRQILGRIIYIRRGDQVISLHNFFKRKTGVILVKIVPIIPLFIWITNIPRRVVYRLLKMMQSHKAYRKIARNLFPEKLYFRIATDDDAFALAKFFGYQRTGILQDLSSLPANQSADPKNVSYTFIAQTINKKILGAAVLVRSTENGNLYPGWWIFNMQVRVLFRGVGVGESLLKHSLNYAQKKGASTVNLISLADNNAAIGLYKKMGYSHVSITALDQQLKDELQKNKQDRILFSKSLSI